MKGIKMGRLTFSKAKDNHHYLVMNGKQLLGQTIPNKKWNIIVFEPIMSTYDIETLHLSSDCLREIADFIDMDPECIYLCDVINKIWGIKTTESCCGHGKLEYCITIVVYDEKYLNIITDNISLFRWELEKINMDKDYPNLYNLISIEKGEKAYRQADTIAKNIENILTKNKKMREDLV